MSQINKIILTGRGEVGDMLDALSDDGRAALGASILKFMHVGFLVGLGTGVVLTTLLALLVALVG